MKRTTAHNLGTQSIGSSSPDVASRVSVNAGGRNSQHIDNEVESHDLTPAVAVCHAGQSDGVSGFESPSLRQSSLPLRSELRLGKPIKS